MKFGFRKRAAEMRRVECPHCGWKQEVEDGVLSTFCRRCHSRIEANGSDGPVAEERSVGVAPVPGRTRTATCGQCGNPSEVPEEAVSAFCRVCGAVMSLGETSRGVPEFRDAAIPERAVSCYLCGAECRVPKSAMSALCPKCGGRITLEDIEVLNANRDIVTRGRLHVKAGGRVRASIDAGEATVDGEVRGAVTVERYLFLGPTGRVYGPVVARVLEMAPGAVLVGSLRLNAGASPLAASAASAGGEGVSADGVGG